MRSPTLCPFGGADACGDSRRGDRCRIGCGWRRAGSHGSLLRVANYGGPITDWIFVEFALGGAIHDGKHETTDPDRKELGGRVLVHAAVSVGVMLTDTVSLSLYLDHMSNAGIEERDEGLETAGLCVGFKF